MADETLVNTTIENATNATAVADIESSTPLTMTLKGIAMGFLILMALFGNALVITSVIRIRRLRTITNYFVVSLGVADFLVAALVMPFNAIQEILKRWIFPEWVCYFFNSNDVLFCTASVLNLCMVAVDRYVAIVKPLQYHQMMTKRAAALMIASAWAASLAISYVPIHLNWHLPDFEAVHNPDHCDFKPSAVYSLVSSAISFWLPTLIILFVYGRIYLIAVKQAKEMRKMEKHMANIYSTVDSNRKVVSRSTSNTSGVSCQPSTASSSALPRQNPEDQVKTKKRLSTVSESADHCELSGSASKHKNTSRSSESRATKVLAIVIGCYLLCWMPFFVWLNVMAICGENCPDSGVLGTILFWIGYSNSTFNPVIYAFFSRDFRNAFMASLRIDKWPGLRSFFSKFTNRVRNEKKPPVMAERVLPKTTGNNLRTFHSTTRRQRSSQGDNPKTIPVSKAKSLAPSCSYTSVGDDSFLAQPTFSAQSVTKSDDSIISNGLDDGVVAPPALSFEERTRLLEPIDVNGIENTEL